MNIFLGILMLSYVLSQAGKWLEMLGRIRENLTSDYTNSI